MREIGWRSHARRGDCEHLINQAIEGIDHRRHRLDVTCITDRLHASGEMYGEVGYERAARRMHAQGKVRSGEIGWGRDVTFGGAHE